MRLLPGTPAPALVTTDFLGQPVQLAALRGRKVLLSFYRYASCPICNLRVRELIQAHGRLAAQGLEVLAVFQSPAESMAAYVGRQDAPFPLIGDPDMTLYRRFGVERRWLGLLTLATMANALRAFANGFAPGRIDGPVHRTPADFLIDEQGLVAVAHYGRDPGDHLSLAAIEQWLRDPVPEGVPA